MLNLRFEVSGQVQLSRNFDRLGGEIVDMLYPFTLISQDFYASQKSTFDAEGAFEGKKKWDALSPEYARWKDRKSAGTQLLVLSGRLKRSATTQYGEGSIFRLNTNRLEMGVDVPVNGWNLAVLHQFGTRKMPVREVIRLSDKQKNRWVRIIRDWHYKLIGKVMRSK